MQDRFAGKAEWFDDHYRAVRGRVRLELVLERLSGALPPPPARILDVGGGTGAFAIPVARLGHRVTVLDPSAEWLDRARSSATAAEVEVAVTERTRPLSHGRVTGRPDRRGGSEPRVRWPRCGRPG